MQTPASSPPAGASSVLWTIAGACLCTIVMQQASGLVVGAALGYTFAQASFAVRLNRWLAERILALEEGQSHETVGKPTATVTAVASSVTPSPARSADAPPPAPPTATTPTPAKETVSELLGVSAAPDPLEVPPPGQWIRPERTRPEPEGPNALDRQITAGRESFDAWLHSGNWIARFGIAILFFGGSFLAKYANDRFRFFTLELRLSLLATGAIALLSLGWRLREKNRNYALILQGGGVAVLYLTVYASMRLYHLIPPDLALPLMIVVALAAAVLAVAQNALVLAVIGFAGGFVAPILVSSGSGDHVALFSYYAVLNLGVFAIAWFRAWRVLNLIGFVFTFGITTLWRRMSYTEADLVTTEFFLLLFFALYVAVSILFAIRQPPKLKGYVSGTLVFGLPIVVFALEVSLLKNIEDALAWRSFGFGVFYLLLAWLLYLTRNPNLRLLSEAFAALGVIFASLAVPLGFDPDTASAIWAVEGAGLLWLGVRQDRALARGFGALLQLGSGASYLMGYDDLVTTQPILNSAYMGAFGLALAGFLSARWMHRARELLAEHEQGLHLILLLWSLAWWLGGGLDELNRITPAGLHYGVTLSYIAVTALLLHVFCSLLKWPLLNRMALALSSLTLGLGAAIQMERHHPLAEGGYFGWPALLLVQIGLLYRQDKIADEGIAPTLHPLHALYLWVIAILITLELHWQVALVTFGVWPELVYGIVPVLLVWMTAKAPAIWPLSRHRDSYRFLGAIPLAIFTWLWILGINLSSDGDPAPLSYLPLLNPLDVSVALAGMLLAIWWLALDPEQRKRLKVEPPQVLPGAVLITVFLWLNAALIRALHYGMGTPLDFEGAMQSFVVQAALSIFWGILGFTAMILATRRGIRILWLAGVVMMAVVVVKLFTVDLSGSGTLARIVSFIGVGVLLLITGYFSPLPPKRAEETAE